MFYTLPWLGSTQLPVLNAGQLSDKMRKVGMKTLERKGIRQALQADVRLYERVVGRSEIQLPE